MHFANNVQFMWARLKIKCAVECIASIMNNKVSTSFIQHILTYNNFIDMDNVELALPQI